MVEVFAETESQAIKNVQEEHPELYVCCLGEETTFISGTVFDIRVFKSEEEYCSCVTTKDVNDKSMYQYNICKVESAEMRLRLNRLSGADEMKKINKVTKAVQEEIEDNQIGILKELLVKELLVKELQGCVLGKLQIKGSEPVDIDEI